ncbi:Conserved_hypothetical protein [Hexamita inflata]|uniref:Uncharacterized protein n=1 Tax=Hexamita inflata TaxID=28002 RepID=A0AA86PPX5_9EUKA|nr:Conserved hypothetical protein [Hexamita inflata]
MLVFVVQLSECIPSIFTNEVTQNNTNLKITLTKLGVRSFINSCIKNIVEMASRINFPDMSGSIGPFNVQISDIAFTDIQVNNFDFILAKASSIQVNQIDVHAEFTLKVVQNSWPYTQVNTRAQINIQNAGIRTIAIFKESQDCQGHLEFKTENFVLDFERFSFNSDIYLADMLAPVFGDFFKQYLTAPLVRAFESRVNLYLQSYRGQIEFSNDIADQRLYKMDIDPQYISVQMSGLSSYYQEKYASMKKLQENYSNDEINYAVGKAVFCQIFDSAFGEEVQLTIVNLGISVVIRNELYTFTVQPEFAFVKSEMNEDRRIMRLKLVSGHEQIDQVLNLKPYYIFDAIFVGNVRTVYRDEAVVLFAEFE